MKVTLLIISNATGENEQFWQSLTQIWSENDLPRPDLVLGNFNIITEALDHCSHRLDSNASMEALMEMCREMNLRDGWRSVYPDVRQYTYFQASTSSRSRIDRIYCTPTVLQTAMD